MKYLLVVAHPDDEVLGCGATISHLKGRGETIALCIMSGKAEERIVKNVDTNILSETAKVSQMLGITEIYSGSFYNLKMNQVPHIELVKFIENAILDSRAEVIITHNPSDTNNDHYHTSIACQEAVRIYQRRGMYNHIKELWYMEVPSSTDWSLNTNQPRFSPNLFIEIDKYELKKKIEAISCYSGALREIPHPRSKKAICGLASYRGGQAGFEYAEAFECALRRLEFK